MRFKTESGTVYYLDTSKHLFWGGKFKSYIPYFSCTALIGTPAIIYACDGRIIRTSKVVAYV